MIEKFERPWGWYENLQDENNYKVKRLYVDSNQKISLQYHNYRSEHWVVVSGSGIMELDDTMQEVKEGNYIFIPIKAKHRISAGNSGIMIVEVQMGSSCIEEDIVRIQDDYGRV